ncbi:hypothetical protein CONPUDRAFT_92100 [Coniophora puteana RWD-64-598 SS2]|uniref:Uncharacterized protein n=1 Tax=Coniophora puteana (strain RWD-64-598) TaxID=741705 RepID=A0A5M3MFY2_CONPW|nr:uncharacterized protein CONPUDRAFT_92100 [Coniophora puteana RWD-64-598 SS2]EIW77674.1 hypothetical protein CONPUDRAFT_92100 [Coniophora puteana RWD-64-598 SS2]
MDFEGDACSSALTCWCCIERKIRAGGDGKGELEWIAYQWNDQGQVFSQPTPVKLVHKRASVHSLLALAIHVRRISGGYNALVLSL